MSIYVHPRAVQQLIVKTTKIDPLMRVTSKITAEKIQ